MTESVDRRIVIPKENHDGPQPIFPVHTQHEKSQIVEGFKDITFGSLAGIIGKTIEYPFDTIKVRLQSQPDTTPLRYNGPLDCFRQSIHAEGLSGLYRGISAPLLGAAIETSSLFFSYRIAQKALNATFYSTQTPDGNEEVLPLGALVLCGAASGAFTSVLLTPIELVKCQMQVPLSETNNRGSGSLTVISNVYRHRGILGFWHGQLGTLIRETGGSAAWFGSYEGTSALFRHYFHSSPSTSASESSTAVQESLPVWQQMLAGAVAGVSYNFVFYPADTIKSRMQTETVSEELQGQRRTFWTVGRLLWQQQGLKGLYRGCGITVGRAAPSSAFIFAVYEGLRKHFA